jgi:prephenate dehydratase
MPESMTRVAFQGEYGAYSEMAARSYFGEDVDVLPRPNFHALFEAVETGDATHGMVPIENTLMGGILDNYDLLLERTLHIVGETKLRIVHNLIVNTGVAMDDIREIHSQTPALAQCTKLIQELSDAKAVPTHDTAGSVRDLKQSGAKDVAAIASRQAAIDYDLEILQEGIEDNHQNYTRFVVVSKKAMEAQEPSKTSIIFSLKNEPGSLYGSIGAFAKSGINLQKIESRPIAGKPFEYTFYLDFEGSRHDSDCLAALDELATHAATLRVLGSYQQGDLVNGTVRPKLEKTDP